MKFNKHNLPSGFTLFEVMVTMAIMIVVFGMAITELKPSNSRSSLVVAVENLVSDLRTTAMFALNSQTLQTKSPSNWGVYFDTNAELSTYTIFADLNSDGVYNSSEKFKTITLASNISVSCVAVVPNTSGCISSPTLLFRVPDASPYLGGGVTDAGDISIRLEDVANSSTKNILINSLGVISFE